MQLPFQETAFTDPVVNGYMYKWLETWVQFSVIPWMSGDLFVEKDLLWHYFKDFSVISITKEMCLKQNSHWNCWSISRIITKKSQVMVSNVKFWSRKTEIIFYFNHFSFIYNLYKSFLQCLDVHLHRKKDFRSFFFFFFFSAQITKFFFEKQSNLWY